MPCRFALMPCSKAESFPCGAVRPMRMIGKAERNLRKCFKVVQECEDFDAAVLREAGK